MSTAREGPTALLARPHLAAHLPSGALLVIAEDAPSEGVQTCPGPDAWGRCPIALAGQTPTCSGAEWHRLDRLSDRTWRFTFVPDETIVDARVCPVSILEPLGGVVYRVVSQVAAAP